MLKYELSEGCWAEGPLLPGLALWIQRQWEDRMNPGHPRTAGGCRSKLTVGSATLLPGKIPSGTFEQLYLVNLALICGSIPHNSVATQYYLSRSNFPGSPNTPPNSASSQFLSKHRYLS